MAVKSTLSEAELAWTNLANGIRVYRHKWFGLVRDSEIHYHVHPTQKPVALMRWIIERYTSPGDLVLDPYMGSGPVARACLDTRRRYIGIEIEEQYCAVAVQRLQQSALPLESTS
jgi:DNA modification methylase